MEWNRMPGMDLADLYYDAFLANGEIATSFAGAAPGERVRLRIVNGSASSHFWLHYAGGEMTVVAADGIDVEPVDVDKMLIATAETYDVEVTVPAGGGRYEFRATSWDRYKHTSIWIGEGKDHPATALGPIDYYALTGEMREMMKMMPDMVMGKAPAEIPEPRVYDAGEAPSYADIQMQSMRKMGMAMDGMNHQEMNMAADTMAPSPQGMDHGKTIRASEVDGMQMDPATNEAGQMNMMVIDGPMGVQLTGYQGLRNRFPDDKIFDYNMLRATAPTTLHEERPERVVHLYLGGNMLRYVWMINNEPLSQADKIMIERGENVRFVFHNTTMMSHPMHLHGHFFRVINAQGAYAPLKHTVNVAPMETTIIEFAATEDKDWFFHCHLLYHMMSGMARIIGYEDSEDLLIADRVDYDKFAMEDRQYYGMANLSAQSNGVWADFGYFNTYNELMLEGEADYDGNFEAETKAMRYLDPKQFFAPYVGVEAEGARVIDEETGRESLDTEVSALLGIRYFLPMMIWSDLRVDHRGKFELQLEREDIPLTSRWRASAGGRYNFNERAYEYTFGTSYILGQYWGVSASYDSDFGLGAGLKIMW
jgi:FtsP/CotA-like multicopper oxidase with cupredoxin domain